MQTIWITGGSSGIGFAVAQKFLEENWRVIISSRNEDKLKKAVEKLKKQTSKKEIFYKTCDVSKYNDVKDTIAYIETDISKIDIALLNAAGGAVESAHKSLCWFLLVGWAIYPIGYMAGTEGWYSGIFGGLDMDVIYNVGDAINKIGFGLVVYNLAVTAK